MGSSGTREFATELRREKELLLYHSDCAHTTHIMLRALTNCHLMGPYRMLTSIPVGVSSPC